MNGRLRIAQMSWGQPEGSLGSEKRIIVSGRASPLIGVWSVPNIGVEYARYPEAVTATSKTVARSDARHVGNLVGHLLSPGSENKYLITLAHDGLEIVGLAS